MWGNEKTKGWVVTSPISQQGSELTKLPAFFLSLFKINPSRSDLDGFSIRYRNEILNCLRGYILMIGDR